MKRGFSFRLLVAALSWLPALAFAVQPPSWWSALHAGEYQAPSWESVYTLTSAHFGPNALPAPEWKDGRVEERSAAEVSADFFAGDGDRTASLSCRLEWVAIPGRLSVEGWGVAYEYYTITSAVCRERASMLFDPSVRESGSGHTVIGDFYLSTNIALLQESEHRPDLLFRIVLKTASSENYRYARFFDTPGYLFDLTCGKSWRMSETSVLKSLRLTGNVGFLCYQMNTRFQNDAPSFYLKCGLDFWKIQWENGAGGYCGWTGDGDQPIVVRSRVSFCPASFGATQGKSASEAKGRLFLQYQYGLNDTAPHRLQLGYTHFFKTN